jgi:hypothetical protein
MAAKLKPVSSLTDYWKREKDFRRRQVALIDEKRVFSLDTPSPHYGRTLPPKPRRHSAEWELRRLNHAAAIMPKRLWKYRKVLFAIYYHAPDVEKIARSCGFTVRHYYRVWALLWDFFILKARHFRTMDRGGV